ncbi:MAG: cytochrome b [Gammaproteobacteria bacterium]|nr:cytochrome b [Gammaproteobacteria bacterium]
MRKTGVIVVSVLVAPLVATLAWTTGLFSGPTQVWQTMLFAWPASIAALWMLLSVVLRVAPARRPEERPWSALSKLFHWGMALAILGTTALMYFIVNFGDFDNPQVRAEYGRWLKHHKSLGLIVLFLVVFRWLWNRWRQRPALPSSMSVNQQRTAQAAHGLIYLAMLIVPLLGWTASMTYGGRTHFFGLFELPVWLPKNIAWANVLQPAHIWAAWGLLGLVGLHVAAALWHHFGLRDATLVQMLPRITRGASAPRVRGG